MASLERTFLTDQPNKALRRFGVEEEFLLLDRTSGAPVNKASEVQEAAQSAGLRLDREFLSCQVETATPVCTTAQEALQPLLEFRRAVSQVAHGLSAVLAGSGLPPVGEDIKGGVTDLKRYHQISAMLGKTGWHYYSTGMHIHVEIPNADAGIEVINAVARWMPALLALSANSPIWMGETTGFASWRHTQAMSWPVSNYPPFFDSADHYNRTVDQLVKSQIIPDSGVVNWPVRLSHRFPTVEFRFADSQLRAGDSVALALIVRALTEKALRNAAAGRTRAQMEHAMVTGAMWCAARDGLAHTLVYPVTGDQVPALEFVDLMRASITDELAYFGDTEEVDRYLERRKSDGGPAQVQLRTLESAGVTGVLALFDQEILN